MISRVQDGCRYIIPVAFVVLLAACTSYGVKKAGSSASVNDTRNAGVEKGVFVDPKSDFRLTWPTDRFTQVADEKWYLLPSSWRIDMSQGEPGRQVASWQLRHSNAVTAATLRYGVSHDATSLAHCLSPGGGWQRLPTNQVMVGGRPFTHFRLRGAAMSHYMQVDAYRSRYNGHCYAIDLVVHGTNPQVYSPPRKPPFTKTFARRALHHLLLRIEWLALPGDTPDKGKNHG